MRETVRQGRDAAQPGGPHDRRHVVHRHPDILVAVGRDRRAVAHLENLRHGGDHAGQQQGQGRGAVRRIACGEVVAGHAARRVEPAADIHDLGCAFRFPGMLLLPRELHPHRAADGARQQGGVGADIVRTVAAVAAGGLVPDDLDPRFGQAEQKGEVRPQRVRILRAGPDGEPVLPVVRDRAGRADRAVHLIRPDIGARHLHRRAGDGRRHVALVQQRARRRGLGPQRALRPVQVGQVGDVAPGYLELPCRLHGMFLALGHDPDEIADHHHGHHAGHVADGRLVHRDEAVGHEVAAVPSGIRRPHDPAMQHAGHPHVMHVDEFAGRLGRDIAPGHRNPDDAVIRGRLDGGLPIDAEPVALTRQEFAIAQMAVAIVDADGAVRHGQILGRCVQRLCRPRDQEAARGRGSQAEGDGGDLDRLARDGRALVRHAPGMAEHHRHLVERDVEFFRDDLPQGRADAGAKVDMAVEGGDGPVLGHGDEDLRVGSVRPVVLQDQERAGGQQQGGFVELRQGGRRRHAAAPASGGLSWPAARRTARRISTWVPQRHRLYRSASRISGSVGAGLRSSSAFVVMIIPFRQ